MENQNDTAENLNSELHSEIREQYIMSTEKFIFLSIATFGLYSLRWMYKSWHFYRQKDNSDVKPLPRAILYFVFLFSLNEKILSSALEKGYSKRYPPALLSIGFILFSLAVLLPYPFSLFSILSLVFIIPSFKAFNYYRESSTQFEVIDQSEFNDREEILIILGSILWFIIFVSLTGSFNITMRTD